MKNYFTGETVDFYSVPEYENWQKVQGKNWRATWSPKYYKGEPYNCIMCFSSVVSNKMSNTMVEIIHILNFTGLGSSTAKEGKDYFRNLEHHVIRFRYESVEDDKAIERVCFCWLSLQTLMTK